MKAPQSILLLAGWLFTGLAFLGALLPLVPTTPFLLLAGICFARSSPAMHQRVLQAPIFGKYLRQWDREHTVPKDAKYKAWFVIALSFGFSIYVVDRIALRVMLIVLALVLAVVIARLPEVRAAEPVHEEEGR
ncbi:MAG TPA: YbaN family protein [Planctomycetota bacterium]|nr:YbaN family protein [Planctomycetota bacterium]HRV80811.1 YbaN family protein [Planctomycetota bacterium]